MRRMPKFRGNKLPKIITHVVERHGGDQKHSCLNLRRWSSVNATFSQVDSDLNHFTCHSQGQEVWIGYRKCKFGLPWCSWPHSLQENLIKLSLGFCFLHCEAGNWRWRSMRQQWLYKDGHRLFCLPSSPSYWVKENCIKLMTKKLELQPQLHIHCP
jgi:hypothetical protein